jgi:hypothetical protein
MSLQSPAVIMCVFQVHHLSSIGGVSVENAVGRLLKVVFTDETVSNYTWEGATGKRKLSDLLLITSVFGKH